MQMLVCRAIETASVITYAELLASRLVFHYVLCALSEAKGMVIKMKIKRFEDIEAWQLARELTRKVYRLTKKPGFTRDYGLKRQIQKAAGSSMHNIAEGFDSESNAESRANSTSP